MDPKSWTPSLESILVFERRGKTVGKRRKYPPDFKARVVMEIVTGEKTTMEASREYRIKDSVLYRWKSEFWERLPQIFGDKQDVEDKRKEEMIAELQRKVGQLTMDNEILKKASHYLKSPSGGSAV